MRAMRREPTQERSRATVERILAAARSVLVERGYDGASTNQIAAAAAVSPGTLYQYFPDKEAILDRVVERVVEELETRVLLTFLRSLQAGQEKVRDHLESLLDTVTADADLIRAIADHAPQILGTGRAGFARRVDQLVAGVLLAQHSDTDTVPAETIAWMLVRTVEHVTLSWVLEAPDVPRATLVDQLAAMVTSYLAQLG
jgi:AcrR family transcriptional regulator